MEHALPRRTAGTPRTWSLCMTSENHGTVGPAGCKFSHAPEKHERVLVVEVPAAAGAPTDQVNLQLVTSAGGRADIERALKTAQAWANEEYMCGRRMGKGEPAMSDRAEAAKCECIAAVLALAAPVAVQASPVAAPEWISVDETDPPESELIAVRYWPYGNRENPQAVTGGRYIDGTFYNDEGNELHPPSHWCRLPYFDAEATAQASTSGERQEGGA